LSQIATNATTNEAAKRPQFRPTLLAALRYISAWATAEVLWAVLNDEELLSALEEGVDAHVLVERLGGGDERAAHALLEALRCEGVLERVDNLWRLAPELEELRAVRGWLELFLAGYRPLFQKVGTLIRDGAGSVPRSDLHVALASAAMAAFDAIPLILRLMERVGPDGRSVLDYGCGNASYLTTLCRQNPTLQGVGVEVAEETVVSAREHVESCGMSDRISIVHASAPDFVPDLEVDFVVFAFVLHEVVADRGIEGTVEFLHTVGQRFPDAKLLVVEVSDPHLEGRSNLLAEDPQGRGYYNWYVWLHSVTNQRLLREDDWIEIFTRAGFRLIAKEGVDPVVDPTGLEMGYGLEFADG
jgi:2-ketoarginine methyltransferase